MTPVRQMDDPGVKEKSQMLGLVLKAADENNYLNTLYCFFWPIL